MALNLPPAYMGFVGYLAFESCTANTGGGMQYSLDRTVVRATSADIGLRQEITKPDVIDSRYDRTVYQLGPKIIEGGVAFPAIYGLTGTSNITLATYYLAAMRNINDGSLSTFDMSVKYAKSDSVNKSEFMYLTNLVNSWQFSVSAEEVVNITLDLIGVDRVPITAPSIPFADLSNSRIVTWNDAVVVLAGPDLSNDISGEYVRSFEANINNNAERFYTLNGVLSPQAIAPTKRDLNGNIVLLGRIEDLALLAYDNELRCEEESTIRFGFDSSIPETETTCQGKFVTTFPNVVFEIEEIALTNDLFESTVNWSSLPAAGVDMGAVDPILANVETE
jgi:hypothetical protein